MSILDDVCFTHSALTIIYGCGNRHRLCCSGQLPWDLKSGDIFGHIKRK